SRPRDSPGDRAVPRPWGSSGAVRRVDLVRMASLDLANTPRNCAPGPMSRARVPIIGGSCGHPARPGEAHQAMDRAWKRLARGYAALHGRSCATLLPSLAAVLLLLSSCVTMPPETPSAAPPPAPSRATVAPGAQPNRAGVPHGPAPAAAPGAEPHVALLLPLTGRQGAAAATIRDGFLTAYYV